MTDLTTQQKKTLATTCNFHLKERTSYKGWFTTHKDNTAITGILERLFPTSITLQTLEKQKITAVAIFETALNKYRTEHPLMALKGGYIESHMGTASGSGGIRQYRLTYLAARRIQTALKAFVVNQEDPSTSQLELRFMVRLFLKCASKECHARTKNGPSIFYYRDTGDTAFGSMKTYFEQATPPKPDTPIMPDGIELSETGSTSLT
jgi:hypothetical protein